MMNKIINRLFLLPILLSLTHCTTLPQPAKDTYLSWEKRQQTLLTIQNWNLQGAVAIHAPRDNISASLHWEQHNQNYLISLFGPFGAGSITLKGQAQSVQLSTGDGKTFTAHNPEALMLAQLNWQLPVSGLKYWIRGVPAPTSAAKKSFDAYQRLTTLTQQGWTIQFLRYTTINGVDLPTKLVLTYPAFNVKIIVSQWQL